MKSEQDLADNLMSSIPADRASQGENEEKLQTGRSCQKKSEGDVVMTGNIHVFLISMTFISIYRLRFGDFLSIC